MSRAHQLALPLAPVDRGARPFLIGPSNELAAGRVLSWPDWPETSLLLVGPPACGKTHLLKDWVAMTGADHALARDLTLERALGGGGHFAVDEVEGLRDPAALFHLINAARQAGHFLLLTSRRSAADLDIPLRDLMTRLKAMATVAITEPDEALFARLLARHLEARQISADPAILSYLTARCERTGAAALELARRLDVLSLARRRPVGMDLAREALTD